MQTNYHGGNKVMVIHVVHHIGITSTCLASTFLNTLMHMVFSGLLLTLDNVQALNMSWMKKQNRKSMRKCIKGSINL